MTPYDYCIYWNASKKQSHKVTMLFLEIQNLRYIPAREFEERKNERKA